MNNIKRTVSRLQWRVVPIIFAGILLFLLTLDLSGRNGLSRTQALTDNTLDTLRLQCISFHKLESADGTKSLFRLADSVQALSRHLELDPTLASNAYLEDFVDEIRLSGVALLNADLQLEASGYTRQYAGMAWPDGAFTWIVMVSIYTSSFCGPDPPARTVTGGFGRRWRTAYRSQHSSGLPAPCRSRRSYRTGLCNLVCLSEIYSSSHPPVTLQRGQLCGISTVASAPGAMVPW